MLPLHLDCDPGCDDAIAIWLALATPGIELAAITTVAGNVSAAQGAHNARRILDAAGRHAPVHVGHERGVPDAVVHGEDGLAGLDLPPPSAPPHPQHATGVLGDARHLVAIGPLTNVAAVLAQAPGWRPESFVWMGGAIGPGNVTQAAEFNAHCDPASVVAVLQAGLAPLIVPWDAALQVLTTDARLALLCGRVGHLAASMLRGYRTGDMQRYGTDGGALPDPLAIAALSDPELFAVEPVSVKVGPDGATRFGAPGGGPPARLVTRVDADRFFDVLARRLASL